MSYNTNHSAVRRLMGELHQIKKNPDPDIEAYPVSMNNLFEWHFTIRGPRDSPYAKGIYHGKILLPIEYPFKPPDMVLLTPNGRFETGKKICLSMTSYHPESWKPSWNIKNALTAIRAFFPNDENGIGALRLTKKQRLQLAERSHQWACQECKKSNGDILKPLDDEKVEEEEEEEEGKESTPEPMMESTTEDEDEAIVKKIVFVEAEHTTNNNTDDELVLKNDPLEQKEEEEEPLTRQERDFVLSGHHQVSAGADKMLVAPDTLAPTASSSASSTAATSTPATSLSFSASSTTSFVSASSSNPHAASSTTSSTTTSTTTTTTAPSPRLHPTPRDVTSKQDASLVPLNEPVSLFGLTSSFYIRLYNFVLFLVGTCSIMLLYDILLT